METQATKTAWKPTCRPREAFRAAELRIGITCVVCGTLVQVTPANDVLLCGVCRRHFAQAYATLDRRIEAAIQSFCAVLDRAKQEDQIRYDAVCEARRMMQGRRKSDAVYRASVMRCIAAAMRRGDGLSIILRAEAELYTACNAIGRSYRELDYARECEQTNESYGISYYV